MYRWLLLLLVLIAAGAGLAIGVLNPDPVVLDIGVLQPELPLGGLVLFIFAAGVIAGLLLFWFLFDLPARLRRRVSRRKPSGSGLPTADD